MTTCESSQTLTGTLTGTLTSVLLSTRESFPLTAADNRRCAKAPRCQRQTIDDARNLPAVSGRPSTTCETSPQTSADHRRRAKTPRCQRQTIDDARNLPADVRQTIDDARKLPEGVRQTIDDARKLPADVRQTIEHARKLPADVRQTVEHARKLPEDFGRPSSTRESFPKTSADHRARAKASRRLRQTIEDVERCKTNGKCSSNRPYPNRSRHCGTGWRTIPTTAA